jgi:hypothetical protein
VDPPPPPPVRTSRGRRALATPLQVYTRRRATCRAAASPPTAPATLTPQHSFFTRIFKVVYTLLPVSKIDKRRRKNPPAALRCVEAKGLPVLKQSEPPLSRPEPKRRSCARSGWEGNKSTFRRRILTSTPSSSSSHCQRLTFVP